MKKKFLLCLSVFTATFVHEMLYGQQIPLTSQYMFNQLVVNPAVAGTGDHTVIRLINRNQWVGVEGAPVTQTLSMHTLIDSYNLGLGGYVFRDAVGPFTQTGAQAAAAYHIKLTEETKLSLALQGGILQYSIDVKQLTPAEQNDPVVAGKSTINANVPDATFGAYLYSPLYYVGLSVPHLIAGKIKTSDIQVGSLDRHYLLIAGTFINLSDVFRLEPSILGRYVAGQFSLDVSAKVFFQNMIWLGVSVRPQDAVVMLLGIKMFDKLYLGYSYDITTNGLSVFSKGSHEIMLGFNIFSKAQAGRRPNETGAAYE